MSKLILQEFLSDSDMKEWLKYSKDLLSAVDETIELTPIDNRYASTQQKVLRFLFMDSRSASYDICVLAESLLNNKRHHFSRAIESSKRLLWENTIDYFYISQSDKSTAERRKNFMLIANTKDKNDRKRKEKAFKKRYGVPGRDGWSGKTREEKTDQGIQRYPPFGVNQFFTTLVKPTFNHLNERVHGNTMVGSYFSFDKHGVYADEYRGQVAMGLLTLLLFYFLSYAYCEFTGRGSEIRRFEFYDLYTRNLLLKNPGVADSENP